MKIPRHYMNAANAIIDKFYTEPMVKQGRPFLSRTQVREQITNMVALKTEEDGTAYSTWIECDHCENGIYFSDDRLAANGTVADQTRGLCYQCYGKGRQSPADVRRNAGYQWRKNSWS